MKRIACVFLTLLLLFPLAPVRAAEKGKIRVTSEKENPVRGDIVTFTLEMTRNPGVNSLLTTLQFDPKVLRFMEVQDSGILSGFVPSEPTPEGNLVLRWKEGDRVDSDACGTLATVKFSVLDSAPYGRSALTPILSEKLYDAQNTRGQAVLFETQEAAFELICYHLNQEIKVTREPTFTQAGQGVRTCHDCGGTWEVEVDPAIVSEDGKTQGTVKPGEYKEEDRKGIRTDFLYGGADYSRARELFGDTMIRAFQISFTKNDSIFTPKKESRITLSVDFELPLDFALYVLRGNSAEKVDVTRSGTSLNFEYKSGCLVLVSRESELPPVTTAPPAPSTEEETTTTTLTPQEASRRREMITLSLLGALLLICAVLTGLLLRHKKHF